MPSSSFSISMRLRRFLRVVIVAGSCTFLSGCVTYPYGVSASYGTGGYGVSGTWGYPPPLSYGYSFGWNVAPYGWYGPAYRYRPYYRPGWGYRPYSFRPGFRYPRPYRWR